MEKTETKGETMDQKTMEERIMRARLSRAQARDDVTEVVQDPRATAVGAVLPQAEVDAAFRHVDAFQARLAAGPSAREFRAYIEVGSYGQDRGIATIRETITADGVVTWERITPWEDADVNTTGMFCHRLIEQHLEDGWLWELAGPAPTPDPEPEHEPTEKRPSEEMVMLAKKTGEPQPYDSCPLVDGSGLRLLRVHPDGHIERTYVTYGEAQPEHPVRHPEY